MTECALGPPSSLCLRVCVLPPPPFPLSPLRDFLVNLSFLPSRGVIHSDKSLDALVRSLLFSDRQQLVHTPACVLQCVAVCCSALRCISVRCSDRQQSVHTPVYMLQCVAVCYSASQCVAVCRSVLQCVAVCCIVMQCVPARSSCRYTLLPIDCIFTCVVPCSFVRHDLFICVRC